jgi:mannose-6-phosphate isomerase-like protein (cupin superfamily)
MVRLKRLLVKELAMDSLASSVNIVRPGEGEAVVVGPIATRIIEDGSHTDGHMGAIIVTVAPHSPGPPQHVHRQHDEGFLVMSGRMRFTMGEKIVDAPAGAYVPVPRNTPHTFSNPFDEGATMFVTMTPDLYVPYFRDLKELQDGIGLNGAAILKIMSRYATEPA